jgi:hypothetical protein
MADSTRQNLLSTARSVECKVRSAIKEKKEKPR